MRCRRRCCPSQLCRRLAAAITVSHCNCADSRFCPLPHTPCRRCTLLHARRIRCPLPHARWLHAVHRDHSPGRRRLLLHTCTLLAAAPMPPLLHTAACMPLPPLLPPPLPPLPQLVPCQLIQLMWLSGRPMLSVAKVGGSVPAKCQRSLLKPIRLVAKLVQLLTNAWFLHNPMSSPLVTG
jgi:hypothetical protein